jgi:hypothetical protein
MAKLLLRVQKSIQIPKLYFANVTVGAPAPALAAGTAFLGAVTVSQEVVPPSHQQDPTQAGSQER